MKTHQFWRTFSVIFRYLVAGYVVGFVFGDQVKKWWVSR